MIYIEDKNVLRETETKVFCQGDAAKCDITQDSNCKHSTNMWVVESNNIN